MEPIAATGEVFEEFRSLGIDTDLRDYLLERAEEVRKVVPSCVGLSLASMKHGVTFTLEATSREFAALDSVQYLDGGPCDSGAHEGEMLEYNADDPTDERRWELFAASTAAHNVASTLTLPLVVAHQVAGTVNLYASRTDAFKGHHDEVAAIFGARAHEAVTNADLGFRTRRDAERAPRVLRDQNDVTRAAGVLMTRHGIDRETARDLIEQSARRGGVSDGDLAREILRPGGRE
ncbi:ANTAR domain-containing protein [Nocardioides dongxiaopingii]|uniref:ANTAR domain-containing protein n=1 Tax=Nocardioides TaxID=1839 RepID=UPI0010C767BB|nr:MULTISPECIES: ANTAR domain-containing protein [Nocardioides]QCW49306.1 ANTAR domain-containing protein [Nocardioides sp. S-1144]